MPFLPSKLAQICNERNIKIISIFTVVSYKIVIITRRISCIAAYKKLKQNILKKTSNFFHKNPPCLLWKIKCFYNFTPYQR